MLFDSSRSAIAALCAAFAARHPRTVAFHTEDPGYRGAVLMARDHGLDLRFHRTEPDGIDVTRLGDRPAIVFTTPAHQYPMGYRMGVDRRVALVEWARRTGSLVIEDDYDGEYRYGVAPLPALASLDGGRDHVAYVGTSSKSLAPDLRVAWCVPPTALRRDVERWLAVHRRGPSSLPADALGAFISAGAMDRHLSRAARVYSDRRAQLVAALGRECPELTIAGVQAGLHLCVVLPATAYRGTEDEDLVSDLAAAGWRTRSLSSQGSVHRRAGLVLNYARLSNRDATEFAITLRSALTAPRPRLLSK